MCDANWNSENDFTGKWIFNSGEKTFKIGTDGNQLMLILPDDPPDQIPATYTAAQNGEPAHVDVAGKTYAFIPDGCGGPGNSCKKLLVVDAETLQVPTQIFRSDDPTEGERYIEEDS